MWEIKKELENRKENLIYTLKNKKDFLELEKQHQIYGAIKELDHIIKLMEQYREDEMMSKPRELVLNDSSEEKSGALKVVSENVRKFKIPIKIKFQKE